MGSRPVTVEVRRTLVLLAFVVAASLALALVARGRVGETSLDSWRIVAALPTGLVAVERPHKAHIATAFESGRPAAPARKEIPWPEHPRPGLVRDAWVNLNGAWSFRVTSGGAAGGVPARITNTSGEIRRSGSIVVPFAIESNLSGVGWKLAADELLWYERSVEMQPARGMRYLLHFEAVDYECAVAINGNQVGRHRGGNTPFSFEITSSLRPGTNFIVVKVLDVMGPYQLGGKQSPTPRLIWYSQSSGIRGTVWLEEVPYSWIRGLKIHTRSVRPHPVLCVDADVVHEVSAPAPQAVISVTVLGDGGDLARKVCQGFRCEIEIPAGRLWTPADPHLFNLRIELLEGLRALDSVASYAGLRTVGKRRDSQGNYRFTLNEEFIFHWGPLDQGWWLRGGLTPDTEEDMVSDVGFLKAAGFNMIRKHVKVEPRRYYYHCDKIGMLVWQDQVAAPGCAAGRIRRVECGGAAAQVSPQWVPWLWKLAKEASWPDEWHQQYMAELREMVGALYNNPSVVVWTPFNEAWGQHRTEEIGESLGKLDETRLVNMASGGFFFPVGDIADFHSYPSPKFDFAPVTRDFVKVVGEFGGFKQEVRGHTWSGSRNWGYDSGSEELLKRIKGALEALASLVRQGVAGAVYTQTTDVEGEINGLLTFDRAVQKISAPKLKEAVASARLFEVAQEAASGSAR